MTFFIELRTKIRKFAVTRERWIVCVLRFVLALVALLVTNSVLGYQDILNRWWVAVIIALICAFIQIQGVTAVIIFYGLLHLMTLSMDVAVAAVMLLVVSYAVCAYFQSKSTYHLIAIPICFQFHVPFLMPLGAGLLGGINEFPSVLLGAVVSYFLRTVSINASMFLEAGSEMTASALIQSKLLASPMFYIYLVAMSVVFILVYYIRTSKIKHAWSIAVVVGVVTEYIIMLAGYLFAEGRSGILSLSIGSVVTLVIGLILTFLIQGVDYSRTEQVLFEDDDYYYYVTAVPKMHIAEQEKEIKKITGERE